MGSINSRPKAPPVQQYTPPVYQAPQPVEITPVATEEEVATEARTESLLRRSRGRFGTILTSFRGFLNAKEGSETSSRKTLLGE